MRPEGFEPSPESWNAMLSGPKFKQIEGRLARDDHVKSLPISVICRVSVGCTALLARCLAGATERTLRPARKECNSDFYLPVVVHGWDTGRISRYARPESHICVSADIFR